MKYSTLVIAAVLIIHGPQLPRVSGIEVPEAVVQAERARIDAIAKATKSAVAVFGVGDAGGGGSAVVITADGYALTNFHVAKPVGDHLKCGMSDGELYDAVIVGIDPTGDVALIKLLGREDFPAAEIGDSDALRAGDWCFAVGNPFLLATDFHPTVTYGIVSGVHRYQYPAGTLLEYTDCIQTDAAINPGNSGGPLFNADGQLVGINGRGSFEKRGRVNVGVGYSISINQIKNFMGYLRSGRIVDHATLGASVSTDEDGRVVVTNILDSSDAYRRGLRYGDEIVAFGGRPIRTTNAFKNVLGIFPKGWRIPLSFRRQGQRQDILVRLAGVHSREELIDLVQSSAPTPTPPQPRPRDPDRKPDDEEPRRPGRKTPESNAEPKQKAMPKVVAEVFEARRGYSNYFFNKFNLERIWEAHQTNCDLTEASGAWTIEGGLQDGPALRITIDDELVAARWGDSDFRVGTTSDLSEQLDPEGSGGLLLALHQWRRMLTLGPAKYGDVYYLGTAPLSGYDQLVDVLVATNDVIETRFMFDVQSGTLLALEMYPDIETDPCEVYFREYSEMAGRQVPRVLDVVFGSDKFGTLRIDAFEFLNKGDGRQVSP